jgi:hypothetical protein
MPSFKSPTFQERAELAAKARQAALDKLRDKAPIDEATLAERRQAQLARDAAEAERRDAKLAARELEKAARKLRAEEKREAEKPVLLPTAAELKAARDARYARRKSRSGKG